MAARMPKYIRKSANNVRKTNVQLKTNTKTSATNYRHKSNNIAKSNKVNNSRTKRNIVEEKSTNPVNIKVDNPKDQSIHTTDKPIGNVPFVASDSKHITSTNKKQNITKKRNTNTKNKTNTIDSNTNKNINSKDTENLNSNNITVNVNNTKTKKKNKRNKSTGGSSNRSTRQKQVDNNNNPDVSNPDSYVEVVKTAEAGPTRLSDKTYNQLKKDIKKLTTEGKLQKDKVKQFGATIQAAVSAGLNQSQVMALINSGHWPKISKTVKNVIKSQMPFGSKQINKILATNNPVKILNAINSLKSSNETMKAMKALKSMGLKAASSIASSAPLLLAVAMLTNAIEVEE